jgi:hypothetical protein
MDLAGVRTAPAKARALAGACSASPLVVRGHKLDEQAVPHSSPDDARPKAGAAHATAGGRMA